MNNFKHYFPEKYINELFKQVQEQLDVPISIQDNRTNYIVDKQVAETKGTKLIVNTEGTLILFIKDSCKMSLTKDIFDGALVFNMSSIGFDNSIENFRDNANTLNILADFVDIANNVFQEMS